MLSGRPSSKKLRAYFWIRCTRHEKGCSWVAVVWHVNVGIYQTVHFSFKFSFSIRITEGASIRMPCEGERITDHSCICIRLSTCYLCCFRCSSVEDHAHSHFSPLTSCVVRHSTSYHAVFDTDLKRVVCTHMIGVQLYDVPSLPDGPTTYRPEVLHAREPPWTTTTTRDGMVGKRWYMTCVNCDPVRCGGGSALVQRYENSPRLTSTLARQT